MTAHPQTVSQVLEAAAEVASRTWGRGGLHASHGRPCALETIRDASGTGSRNVALMAAATNRFRTHLGVHGVATWNDAPGRTQTEVVAAFREAAAAARAEETP